MKRKAVLRAVVFSVVLGLAASVAALADDSAAAIAAGGLVPRRETRIVMAKEVLRISLKKIVVDYDFRNDTDQDVTTEVAFPVPPYDNEFAQGDISGQSFRDFKLWVDGKPIHYESEVKATLNGRDVTGILYENHIDIRTFGHYDDTTEDAHHVTQILVPDFTRLPKAAQSKLYKEGLFENRGGTAFSLYTVHLQYHWTQSFQAHSTVHIRHEYTPVAGDAGMVMDEKGMLDAGKAPVNEINPNTLNRNDPFDITKYCLGLPLAKSMAANIHQLALNGIGSANGDETLILDYVDFILTSANTWKRPIVDFTLIVERPKPEDGGHVLVSFCSPQNGKVEKLDTDHMQVHLTNFVPATEMHIGFFEVPTAKPVQPAVKK